MDPHRRTTDPSTCVGNRRDENAARVVRAVMEDGVARADFEIASAADPHNPDRLTDSRLRHGRKYLVECGELMETDIKRRTPSGGWSLVYAMRKG